jgi:hypothetical protein
MSAFMHDRRVMRRTAAGLCGVIAAVYLAIAPGASSMESTEEMSLVGFGVGAASIFLIGAALLLTLDRRPLWAAGAALQLMIVAMYVAVSADRTPAFEAWGIGIRVLQVPLLVHLVLLAVRAARPVEARPERDASSSSTMPSARRPTSSVAS